MFSIVTFMNIVHALKAYHHVLLYCATGHMIFQKAIDGLLFTMYGGQVSGENTLDTSVVVSPKIMIP